MPVNVIGTLKPKNNGKFPVAEAVDIKVTDDLRLDEALEKKADLSSVNFALDNKADKTTTTNLQSQIDQIITPVTQDAEVQNARVDIDGTPHSSLKERLDYDEAGNRAAVLASKSSPYSIWNYLSDGKENTACLIYLAVGETVGSPYASSGKTYIEIPCSSGEIFEISAKSTTSLGLWTFVDAERKVISKNAYGEVDTLSAPVKITAPDNAKKLLVVFVSEYGDYAVKYGSGIYNYFDITKESELTVNGIKSTFTIEAQGVNRFDASLRKGVSYVYTNNTSDSQSLVLYGTSNKTITQSLSSGATIIIIPDADYNQIGGYYNGTGNATLSSSGIVDTQRKFNASFVNNIAFEQGSITSLGTKADNAKRIRTASKLYGTFDIYLPDDFSIVNIAYYNSDGSLDSVVQPASNVWRVNEKTGKYVQFSIKKSDDSDITVHDLKASDALEAVNNKFDLLWINETVFEQGTILSTGQDSDSSTKIRTKYTLSGKSTYRLPDGLLFAKIVYYNLDGSYRSTTNLNTATHTVTDDTYKYRFVVINEETTNISVDAIKGSQTLESLQASVDYARSSPIVEFEIDHSLPDTDAVEVDIGDLSFYSDNIVQSLYEKWDALVEAYPDYITREDAAELLDMEYPAYANYKIYAYKLFENGEYINGDLTRRRKALLIGNVHGDEVCSPFVLYRIAKRLCESTDINAMKLRSAYDIIIVPSINEYGSIHKTRGNGNGVDINRNFPTKSWNESGSGTDRYTGPSAGSEFETQLIMGLTSLFGCDLCLDFHNYANLDCQFYTATATKELLPVSYQCLVDISYSLIEDMPEYFGTRYKLFIDATANAPKSYSTSAYSPGRDTVWWREEEGIVSATVEMSANINYMNGYISHQQNYTPEAFAVGEYTYWVQLLKYAEYALRNTV